MYLEHKIALHFGISEFQHDQLQCAPITPDSPLSILVKECAQFSIEVQIQISNQICGLSNKHEYGMNIKILRWIREFFYFSFLVFQKCHEKPKPSNT